MINDLYWVYHCQNYFQRFLDDVGVIVAMVAITLVAVIVVIIKVILVHSEVNTYCYFITHKQ